MGCSGELKSEQEEKGRTMTKKKNYYVVLAGFERGLTDSWEHCKRMVEGYSGNEYQGFYTLKEAIYWIEDYMEDGNSSYVCRIQDKLMTFKGREALLNYLYYGIDA